MRNCKDTKILFIQYLLLSKYSFLKYVCDIFAMDEYQRDAENLPKLHAMIRIYWDDINEEQQ